MRRTVTLLFLLLASLATAFTGSAAANHDLAAPAGIEQPSPSEGRITEPWPPPCPEGNLCAWPNTTGSADRCTWVNRDNSWRDAPVICSWSETRNVQMLYNNGTNPNYVAVCVYRGFSFTTLEVRMPQGTVYALHTPFRARSHKWITSSESC